MSIYKKGLRMKTPKVEIYTTKICPYCDRAKRLLQQKGIIYQEIDVSEDMALRDAMTKRAGGRTSVPQIFIDGHHVGGSDDLYALDQAGNLDPLLGIA
jgi:glutaredoxin 3